MAEWKLRSGRDADVLAMHELDLVCFEEPFRFDLRTMRRFVRRAGAIVVVACTVREVDGFVIVHLERGGLGYVVTLDVAPVWRRKGVASALMAEAEERVRAEGARRMGLHVFSGNVEAIAFYERLGYMQKDLDKGFYGEGLDAFVYVKELHPG